MSAALPRNFASFLWYFLRPYRWAATVYIFLSLIAGCWGPFNSLLVKYAIDLLASSTPEDASNVYYPLALIVLNFMVFDNFTWRSIAYIQYRYLPIIKNQVLSEMFQHTLSSSHQFFQDNLSGRIANHISVLADNTARIFYPLSSQLIRGFSLVVFALSGALWVNTVFFWVLLIWVIIFFTFSYLMSKQLVQLSDVHGHAESVVSGQLVDSLSNIGSIRIFARNEFEVLRLQNYSKVCQTTYRHKERLLISVQIVQGILICLMLGFMAYFLVYNYERHLLTPGDFALILGISMEVGHMTWYAMSQIVELFEAIGKCHQCLAKLLVPQGVQDREGASDLVVTEGRITFENVKFHYKGKRALFQNNSVTIEGGQKVGLVGYSGSGKSTFVNLILRLFDLNEGRILIDGQDIAHVRQDSLRRNVAMIPQDPSLFHRSLMENIRYGSILARDEDVITASKKAHADVFIKKIRGQYNVWVGERGIKLSGGQRQRIAIARALLKDAPILILDEATSQLDSITEGAIQDSLWELMQGKTTIVIAHRLSTLLHMDRILVFDRGQIVEDGSHQDLLENAGLYKALWDAQVGGFLPNKRHMTR